MPKDPSYNSGRQIFYVDKDTFTIWFKEIYDKSDQYWKGLYITQSFQVSEDGRTNLGLPDVYAAVDDRARHGHFVTFMSEYSGYKAGMYLPLSVISPEAFNLTLLLKMTK
jgi:hypothetical protein